MALSDYLTGDEWDACFYAMLKKSAAPDFGTSMHMTIDALLAKGYVFSGLDEKGHKKQQVCNGINASKIMIFFGDTDGIDVVGILNNGRQFVQKNIPELLGETDDEWQAFLKSIPSADDDPETVGPTA